jgi:hypothetical protein
MFLKTKQSPTASGGPGRFLNNCFTFNLPGGWQDQSVYRFVGPEENGIQQNIMITVEHDVVHTDLIQYADINIHAVEQTLQGYHELKRGTIALDSGQPAHEIVYKWTPVKERTVYQRVIYILEGHIGYILTASFSKKTWKTRGPEIDRILRSFRGSALTGKPAMSV